MKYNWEDIEFEPRNVPGLFSCIANPYLVGDLFVFEFSPQGHDFWADYAYKDKPVDDAFIIALVEMWVEFQRKERGAI